MPYGDPDACDCQHECSRATTGDRVWSAAGTLAGSKCSSCWATTCTSTDECINACSQNNCCEGACHEIERPPHGE